MKEGRKIGKSESFSFFFFFLPIFFFLLLPSDGLTLRSFLFHAKIVPHGGRRQEKRTNIAAIRGTLSSVEKLVPEGSWKWKQNIEEEEDVWK